MAKRLMSIVIVMVVLVAGLLALAWYDGGRVEMRLIEEEVQLPEPAQ